MWRTEGDHRDPPDIASGLHKLYTAFNMGEPARWRPDPFASIRGPDIARSRRVAAARARTKVRRYCKANGLTRLLTLTYGGRRATTQAEVVEDIARAMRRLRDTTGKLPYVWVPELHADGQHYHVHLATGRPWAIRCQKCDPNNSGRGLRQRHRKDPCLACAWGRGFVHAKRLTGTGQGRWQQEAAAATYLAKYIGKTYEDHDSGSHRYDCARGFAPARIQLGIRPNERAVIRDGGEAAGFTTRLRYVWSSEADSDWRGPPTRVAFW